MEQELYESLCFLFWDLNNSPELRALSPSTSHPTAIQYSSFVLSIVTCIFGLVANIMVIFITGFLMKKNKYKIWFLNLALADFIFLLFLPLYAVSVLRKRWPYGSSVCKLYNFLSLVNMYAGIYVLTALNIDRALSVAKPIWHRRFHSRRFCWCMCTVIWISSIMCSIPAIIYSGVQGDEICSLSNYDPNHFANMLSDHPETNLTVDMFPRETCSELSVLISGLAQNSTIVKEWRQMISTVVRLVVPLAVLGYFIPLCVILFSNVIIAAHVKNSKMAALSRLYRVVIFAVMSFFCTKTPYVLTCAAFLVSLCTTKLTLMFKVSIILPLLFSIASTNSLLNPVVYVLVVKEMRSEIVKFLRKSR